MDHVALHRHSINTKHTDLDLFGDLFSVFQNGNKSTAHNKEGGKNANAITYYRERSGYDHANDVKDWIIVAIGRTHPNPHDYTNSSMNVIMTETDGIYNYPLIGNKTHENLIQYFRHIYKNEGKTDFGGHFFISKQLVANRHIIMIMSDHADDHDFMLKVIDPLENYFHYKHLNIVPLDNIFKKSIKVPRQMEVIADILKRENRVDKNKWLVVKP